MGFKKILAGLGGTFLTAFSAVLIMALPVKVAVTINETTFPDPIFRQVISGADYDRDQNLVTGEMVLQTLYTRDEFMAVLTRLMEVNNVTNMSFTIPETAGVPATGNEAGTAVGTAPGEGSPADGSEGFADGTVAGDGTDSGSGLDDSMILLDAEHDMNILIPEQQEDDLLPVAQLTEPSGNKHLGSLLLIFPIIALFIVGIIFKRKRDKGSDPLSHNDE